MMQTPTTAKEFAFGELRARLSRLKPDTAPSIAPSTPIAIVEAKALNPRAIIESPAAPYPIGWAVLSQTKAPTQPVPISFVSDPFQTDSQAYSQLGGQTLYLCITDEPGSIHLLFFDADPAATRATLRAHGVNTGFTLSVTNGGENHNVCAGTPSGVGGWSWLYTSDTKQAARFSTEYFALDRPLLETIMERQWPALQLNYLGQGDLYYGIIPSTKATAIWENSGLQPDYYVSDVFDCEDFSYVYKGRVSHQQLVDYRLSGIKFAYAVGSIVGSSVRVAHAVNVFIDETFTAQVLEPQNGDITPGSQWPYTPRTIWF
jgi:agglutinin domain-containing protein